VDELDEWMAVAKRNLRPRVFRDPARGIAWASSGGAAVLLMNDFYPQFVRLGQFLADRRVPADGRGAEIGVPLSLDHPLGTEAGSELSGVELSHLDLGFPATDVGGFDGLDGPFTAIDAGIGAGDFRRWWARRRRWRRGRLTPRPAHIANVLVRDHRPSRVTAALPLVGVGCGGGVVVRAAQSTRPRGNQSAADLRSPPAPPLRREAAL
jgi:hypothetical protein